MRSLLLMGVVVLSLLIAGCVVPLTDKDGSPVRIVSRNGVSLAESDVLVEQTPARAMKAQVKGSIYETGEMMSVFGTCLNGSDGAISSGTSAVFNSWYPNGTIFFQNTSMYEMQPGYYLYSGAMSAVQGTYLTEMVCTDTATGEIAKAWGEWQNPFWVRRLALLNDSLAGISGEIGNLSTQVGDISVQLGNLTLNMSAQFEQTWANQNVTNALIEATYTNVTQQLIVVGGIANSSVDRNNSLLYYMLLNLTNSLAPPAGCGLTVVSDPDRVVFWKTWSISSTVTSPLTGKKLKYPDVYCDISTDLPSASTQMTPSGDGFTYSLFINRQGSLFYNVTCCYS